MIADTHRCETPRWRLSIGPNPSLTRLVQRAAEGGRPTSYRRGVAVRLPGNRLLLLTRKAHA